MRLNEEISAAIWTAPHARTRKVDDTGAAPRSARLADCDEEPPCAIEDLSQSFALVHVSMPRVAEVDEHKELDVCDR